MNQLYFHRPILDAVRKLFVPRQQDKTSSSRRTLNETVARPDSLTVVHLKANHGKWNHYNCFASGHQKLRSVCSGQWARDAAISVTSTQGCKRDVWCRDRDETETSEWRDRDIGVMVSRRDRDVSATSPRRDQDETFKTTSRDVRSRRSSCD